MPIENLTRKTVLATNVVMADTPPKRMKGLLGRVGLNDGEALIITPCNSVHMLFMKFSIDVVFLDKDNRVTGLSPSLPPYAFSPIFWKSACALELPTGTINATQTVLGDEIEVK